jgi:hypothetical protein
VLNNFFHRFDGIMEAANAQFAAIKFQASRHSAALGATSAQRESLIGIIVRMHRSTVALSRYTISALGAIIITVCLYAPPSILSSRQSARLYLIIKLDWRRESTR